MILSDFDLENAIRHKRLVVKPFDKRIIKENGLDLRLADDIAYHKELGSNFILDPSDKKKIDACFRYFRKQKSMVLRPHEQVLLSTYEYIKMPDDAIGFVELRSTWGRHGLSMPPTIIDAGFEGNITLEVVNNAPYSIMLKPKLRFAHIIFAKTSNRVKKTYSGLYMRQRGIRFPHAEKVD